jgi:ABC-type multidrug transport system ATPase subunit
MSLITGALYPDEGWAMVGGFDVVKQRSQLRKSLGVCPQFDVLYAELTCWEHMHLYGGMQVCVCACVLRACVRACACACVCVCVC